MPRVPGQDEYGSGFGTLESDEYRCKILSHEEHPTPLGQYNTDPEAKTIWFKLEPMFKQDDPEEELVDKDSGEPISPDKTLIFFYDAKRTGIYQGKIAKARKFLAAALNVPVEEPIEFESYDDLVGKEVICSVIVKKDKNGQDTNSIDAVRAAKKPKPVRTSAAETTKKIDTTVAAIRESAEGDIVDDDAEY